MLRFPHHLRRFRSAAFDASVGVGMILSLVVASCDKVSYVRILDARLSRTDTGLVQADVELEAAEKGGGNVGPYCVSVHYLPLGSVLAEGRFEYPGEVELVEQCGVDLSDGDQRTYRLVSTTVLAGSLPARVQVRQERRFEIFEGVFTPP